MSESLSAILIDELQKRTLSGVLSWQIARRDDSPEIRRQFEQNKGDYGLDSPVSAFLSETKAGRILLLQTVKTFQKTDNIIAVDYDYRLYVQPNRKGEYLDVFAENGVLKQLSELLYSEKDKTYSDGLSRKVSRFIFQMLSEHPDTDENKSSVTAES